jgi:inorganic pyrophosphatase
MIDVKIIGVIILEDEKGMDEKIVSVPAESIDSDSKNINCLEDLPGNVWENIKYFFNHYKDLEPNKFVRIHGFENRFNAIDIIEKYRIIN